MAWYRSGGRAGVAWARRSSAWPPAACLRPTYTGLSHARRPVVAPIPPRTPRPGRRLGLRPRGHRKRGRRRLLRPRRGIQRPGAGGQLLPRRPAAADGDAPPPWSQGLCHAQHARVQRRTGGVSAGGWSRGRGRRRCRACAGRGRGPADPRPPSSVAAACLHADDAHQCRDDCAGGGTGHGPGRRCPGALDRRDHRHPPADGDAAGSVRPRGALRGLLRAVPDERVARRPQRQSWPVRPGLPAAVRAGV